MKKGSFVLLAILFPVLFLGFSGCGKEEQKKPGEVSVPEGEESPAKGEESQKWVEEPEVRREIHATVRKWINRLSWKTEASKDQVAEALLSLSEMVDDPGLAEDVKTAIPEIQRLLEDPRDIVRANAARALLKIGGSEKANAVSALIKDENDEVRKAVVEALDRMKEIGNINLFIQCLEDPNPKVASKAILGLVHIDAHGSSAKILETIKYAYDGELIREGIKALVKFDFKDAARDIADQIRSDDEGVRAEAARAVGQLKVRSLRILKHLINAMEKDEVVGVRKYAFESFKAITGQQMIFNYEELDEEFRAEEALGFREWLERNKNLFEE